MLDTKIPAHVPPNSARSLRLFDRTVIGECPQEVLIPKIHAELGPVTWITNMTLHTPGAWLLTRVDDIQAMLRDKENYTKKGMAAFAQSIGEDWLTIPTEPDPPIHGEYRKAVQPAFTPQRMAALRDQLGERADTLIAGFADRGHCDFIKEFSQKFPIFIVLDLLGLPQERVDVFLEWEYQILHTGTIEERAAGVRKVKDYLVGEIAERRANPRDDFITGMFDYEFEGRKWNDDEVFGHCFNLFIGGLDTVTTMLGNIFNFLARYPDRQDELRANPDLVVPAIEEFLRYFAPVTPFRIAVNPMEIRGQTILPGDYVALCTPVAGQDPTYYDNPGEIRFDRKAPHISLGTGIHKCLGMHLARMELRCALERFFAAIPTFRLQDDFAPGYFVGNIQFVSDLKLQW